MSAPTGSRGSVDIAAVTALVEHVAATVVSPRFRSLSGDEVAEKGPGDLVTVVDTEAEAALTQGLQEIAPGVPVVGEEGTAARPETLAVLREAPRAWLVDPLDGTRAFVEGSPDHAVMVALVERGEAVAGWICLPAHGSTFVAERGAGAWVDGRRLSRPAPDPGALVGGMAVRGLDDATATRLAEQPVLRAAAGSPEPLWSGYEYSRLASGGRDFVVSWGTWPWDHAPGAVLLREVGGVSRMLDGTDYRPAGPRSALLAAADEETWATVREALGDVTVG